MRTLEGSNRIRNGIVGAALCLLAGLLVGWWIGRRGSSAPAAAR